MSQWNKSSHWVVGWLGCNSNPKLELWRVIAVRFAYINSSNPGNHIVITTASIPSIRPINNYPSSSRVVAQQKSEIITFPRNNAQMTGDREEKAGVR